MHYKFLRRKWDLKIIRKLRTVAKHSSMNNNGHTDVLLWNATVENNHEAKNSTRAFVVSHDDVILAATWRRKVSYQKTTISKSIHHGKTIFVSLLLKAAFRVGILGVKNFLCYNPETDRDDGFHAFLSSSASNLAKLTAVEKFETNRKYENADLKRTFKSFKRFQRWVAQNFFQKK